MIRFRVVVNKRTPRQEAMLIVRLLVPGVVFIVVWNGALSLLFGGPTVVLPWWVADIGAIGAMLLAAWSYDRRHPPVPRRALVVEHYADGGVTQIVLTDRPPNPLLDLPVAAEHGPPHSDMAMAVLVEFMADDGPPDVAWLERELDWYLRGIQPMRAPRWPTA